MLVLFFVVAITRILDHINFLFEKEVHYDPAVLVQGEGVSHMGSGAQAVVLSSTASPGTSAENWIAEQPGLEPVPLRAVGAAGGGFPSSSPSSSKATRVQW